MNNAQEQLNRMKVMMTYGLQTENKKNNFSSLEYNRLGADGKMYGIVREGTKYYIKVSENTKNLIKENFEYIGGFRNRKSTEYTSYANALKNFDMKMRSINEAKGQGKKLIAESWNPEKQEFVMVEATQKMQDEIARQRQIMANASIIFEGKDGSCSCGNCDCASSQKGNGKQESAKKGEYAQGTGDVQDSVFDEKVKNTEDMSNITATIKTNIKKESHKVKGKKLNEGDNSTLAWHKTGGNAQETIADTYLDTSKGTSIGDGAPFDGCPKGDSKKEMKNGTVEEEKSMAMDCGDNQNNPKPGVNKIGDGAPFEKNTKNELEEAEEGEALMGDDTEMGPDTPMGDEEPMGGDDLGAEDEDPMGGDDLGAEDEDPMGGDDLGAEDENPMGGDDLDMDLEGDDDIDLEGDDTEVEDSGNSAEIESLRSEINSLKDLLASVAEKLGVSSEEIANSEFNDDSLYPEDNEGDEFSMEDEEDDFDFDGNDSGDDFDSEDEMDFEVETDDDTDSEDDDTEIFESRSYRRMKKLNEDRLDYFGKHPAYRKVPMNLPTTGEDSNEHGRDWNDDSVHNEQPYGEKIGSGAPFEVDPADIENAIAESVKKILGSRKRI